MVDPAGGVELTKFARGTSMLAPPKRSSAAPKKNNKPREIKRIIFRSPPTEDGIPIGKAGKAVNSKWWIGNRKEKKAVVSGKQKQ